MNTDKKSPTSSQSAELTCYAAMNEAQRSEDSTLTDLLCVVSPHEKGFWQADVYFYGWDEGIPPDWFCTGKRGGTKEEIINMVIERYPSARIVDGVLGICPDCGEEYFEVETHCYCGQVANEIKE